MTWSALVAGFLTMVTQQIHSLRWIGVRSFHFARRAASEVKITCRSAGTSCNTPAALSVLAPREPSFDMGVGFVTARGAMVLIAVERLTLPSSRPALDFFMVVSVLEQLKPGPHFETEARAGARQPFAAFASL